QKRSVRPERAPVPSLQHLIGQVRTSNRAVSCQLRAEPCRTAADLEDREITPVQALQPAGHDLRLTQADIRNLTLPIGAVPSVPELSLQIPPGGLWLHGMHTTLRKRER